MRKRNGKKKINLPEIKKDLKDFLMNEEGKIKKENVVKLGISIAILGMMLDPNKSYAQHSDAWGTHNSVYTATGHNSESPHTSSHTNHSSHSSGTCGSISW